MDVPLGFRTHYSDQSITKWEIFHAAYPVLHHPEYRTRYGANLWAIRWVINRQCAHRHRVSTDMST
jgi:predicted helicase